MKKKTDGKKKATIRGIPKLEDANLAGTAKSMECTLILTEGDSAKAIVEKEENAVIVASFGTFSTGINIKRLHNIVFASPSKSRIRNLQSIGRGLRIGEDKENVVVANAPVGWPILLASVDSLINNVFVTGKIF